MAWSTQNCDLRKSVHSIEFAWSVPGRTLYETYMDGVVASVYAFGSAEHFPKGCRHDRKFRGAHAKIEGIYFWAALSGLSTWKGASPSEFEY